MISNSDNSRGRRLIRQAIPVYLCALVFALMPGMQHPAEDVKSLVEALFTVFLAAVWGHEAWQGRVRDATFAPLVVLLGLFAGINVLAAAFSNYPTLSLTGLRDYLYLIVVFAACSHAYTRPSHAWPLFLAIVVTVSTASLYGFAQKAGWDPFPWATEVSPEYLGLPATFGNPNYAAHVLVLAIVLCSGLAIRRRTAWCGVLTAVMLTHLFYTGYRSALVSLGAGLLLMFAARRLGRSKIPSLRAAMFSLAVAVVAGAVAIGLALAGNRIRTGDYLPLDSSILIRYNAYSSAAKMAAARPALGYGYQAYWLENPKFWTPFEQRWFASERTVNKHVHNDALEAAIDGGMGASLAYLGLMAGGILLGFSAAITASRRRRESKEADDGLAAWCLAIALTVFAVDGVFGFNLHTPVSAVLYVVLLGLLQGIYLTRPGSGKMDGAALPMKAAVVATVAAASAAMVFELRSFRAEQHYHLGISAASVNQPEQAFKLVSESEALEPWEGMYPLRLGQFAANIHKPAEALASYIRATQCMPNYLMAHVSVARAALSIAIDQKVQPGSDEMVRLLDLAQHSAETCVALCPVLPSAHEVLGNLNLMEALGARQPALSNAERTEHWKSAQGHYLDSLRYGYSGLGEVQKRLAQVAIGLGDFESADRYLGAAVKQVPRDPELWKLFTAFASDHDKSESLSKGIDAALTSLKDQDKALSVQLLLLQADTYERLGKSRAEKQAIVRKALDVAPERLDVWSTFAALGDSADPVPLLQKEIATILGHYKSGNQQPAAEVSRLAEIVSPGNGAWDKAADLLQRLCADHSKTLPQQTLARQFAWLAHAVGSRAQKMPENSEAKSLAERNIGLVFAMCAQWPQSDHYLQLAHAGLPKDYQMSNLLQRAEVLSNLQRHNESLLLAREAFALEPKSILTNIALARKLVLAGQLTEAHERYQALLRASGISDAQRKAAQQEMEELQVKLGQKQ